MGLLDAKGQPINSESSPDLLDELLDQIEKDHAFEKLEEAKRDALAVFAKYSVAALHAISSGTQQINHETPAGRLLGKLLATFAMQCLIAERKAARDAKKEPVDGN